MIPIAANKMLHDYLSVYSWFTSVLSHGCVFIHDFWSIHQPRPTIAQSRKAQVHLHTFGWTLEDQEPYSLFFAMFARTIPQRDGVGKTLRQLLFTSSRRCTPSAITHTSSFSKNNQSVQHQQLKWKSTATADLVHKTPQVASEAVSFTGQEKPVILNSKEHVVGYLSKILSARVYDAAIETELQHAKNLSEVCVWLRVNVSYVETLLVSFDR